MRWTLVLVPLLMCGLMCFGGVILAAFGISRASRGSGRSRPSPSTTPDRTRDNHAEV